MDPLRRLDPQWDNSLALIREMTRRGHRCQICDLRDIECRNSFIRVGAAEITVAGCDPSALVTQKNGARDIRFFDLVLIRKEPPFNDSYYYSALLLDLAASDIPISNHPAGILKTNEKLATLLFPKWIPETLVTRSGDAILEFQKKIKDSIVLKPLNQKGGKGITLLKKKEITKRRLQLLTQEGQRTLLVQRQLKSRADKRILVLNGKILGAFEKHAPKNDFRTNLSLDGTFHPTTLHTNERQLVREMAPYLVRSGLHLVGIDVMEGKLLDLNVTCPAGMTVLKALHPELSPLQEWASFLEHLRPTPVA